MKKNHTTFLTCRHKQRSKGKETTQTVSNSSWLHTGRYACTHTEGKGKMLRTQRQREGYCITQNEAKSCRRREKATSLLQDPEGAQTWGNDTQGDTFHHTGWPNTDKVIFKLSPQICVPSDSADTPCYSHGVENKTRRRLMCLWVCVCVCACVRYLSAFIPIMFGTMWPVECHLLTPLVLLDRAVK